MRASRLALVFAVATVLSAPQAEAYQVFQHEFDANAPVELSGTVTGLDWKEPHAVIHLAASDAGGPARDWLVEMASPGNLPRMGLAQSALTTGSSLIVRGFRAKACGKGPCKVAGRTLVFSNGRTIYVGVADCGPRDTVDPSVAHPCLGDRKPTR